MGKAKYVRVNNHRANIWDDAFNIVLAHMVEVAATMGFSDEQLSNWVFHASMGGDSFSFSYPGPTDIDEESMTTIVDAARERLVAMGDVSPQTVADWTLGPDDKRISGGALRANKSIEVDRLLDVAEWLAKALRSELEIDNVPEVGNPRR